MADDFDLGEPLVEESPNRTFNLAAAAIGGLLVVSMICLGVYAFVIAPRQREAREQQPTQIALQNTEVALAITQTAEAELAAQQAATDTAEPTVTPTEVVPPTEAMAETATATSVTSAMLTSTAAAAQTLSAPQQATATATASPTALPQTGLVDDIGPATLLQLAGALLAVILITRYLRSRAAS